MRDVDGGRRIYEIDFLFLFCFLFFSFFRAIGRVWEVEIFAGEVFWLVK